MARAHRSEDRKSTARSTRSARAVTIPARCPAPNRRARPGTSDSSVAATSARCRSSTTSASAPRNCDCAIATSSSPADAPRSRWLIDRSHGRTGSPHRVCPPTPRSPRRPEVAVSDASGAPNQTRWRPRFRTDLPRRTQSSLTGCSFRSKESGLQQLRFPGRTGQPSHQRQRFRPSLLGFTRATVGACPGRSRCVPGDR